jgi:hypothetical protein
MRPLTKVDAVDTVDKADGVDLVDPSEFPLAEIH